MQQAVFDKLNQAYRIITATPRLARELTHQYHQRQIAKGHKAWRSPDIISYDQWLTDAWQRFCQLDEKPPRALNNVQSRQIWQNIIDADLNQREQRILCNIDALAHQSMQAFQIMVQYHIDINSCHYSNQSDHRQFALWASNYQHLIKRHHYIDHSQLSDYMRTSIENSSLNAFDIFGDKLYFCGFDNHAPQKTALLDFLATCEINIAHEVIVSDSPDETHYFVFKDSDTQYRHIANWAWQRLQHKPDSRLAIIVPDLAPVREKMARYLRQRLSSDNFYHGVDSDDAFHIALGKKLNQYTLIRHALQLLLPWKSETDNLTLCSFLQNPLLKGFDSEKSARALLDQTLRARLSFSSQWQQFVKEIEFYIENTGTTGLTQLQQCLKAVDILRQDTPKQQQFRQWAQCFADTLDIFGWQHTATLDSKQYQIADAFNETLRELGSIDNLPMSQRVTADEALTMLNDLLQQSTFQSETTHPPLEVLSIHEAAGLQADAVWFANCDNRSWPPSPRPNAFLPISQQSRQGYYAANSELCSDYAEQLMARLYQLNTELIFSYSEYDDEQWAAPCSLLPAASALQPDDSDLWQHLSNQKLAMETVSEQQWVATNETQRQIGSYVLQDQSLCPFKAFARHRLKASFEMHRADGLSSAEQGTLLHQAMQNLFEQYADIRSLKQMDEPTLKDTIAGVTASLTNRLSGQYGLGDALRRFQLDYLNTQMCQWLAQEFCRVQDFTVVACEAAYRFSLNGIDFRLKIDRIDRLSDGSYVLIDYKTGANERVQKWIGERIEAPQMLLYVLSLAHADAHKFENLSAISYAIVHNHRCQYIGLSYDDNFSIKSADPEQPDNKVQRPEKAFSRSQADLQWEDLPQYWQDKIEALCQEYLQGVATVTPYKQACLYCDLQLLCRIDEHDETLEHEEQITA